MIPYRDVAERIQWFRGRPECGVEPFDRECPHCNTVGSRYRYLAESPDYVSHHNTYPTQWYHECGYATDPEPDYVP